MGSEAESEKPQKSRQARRPRRQKAVIDRVEEGAWAVLLVGQQEIEKIVPVDHLPEGARAGTWLKVRIEDDAVRDILVDAAETQVAKARVSSKLDMLRNRKPHFKPVSAAQVQDESNQLANPAPPTSTESSATEAEAAPKLLSGPVEDAPDESTSESTGESTGESTDGARGAAGLAGSDKAGVGE